MRRFIEALLKEAALKAEEMTLPLQTLYLGGGTPSMLSDRHLERLFTGLREIFSWEAMEEVSFEANPATFTQKRADFFVQLGITRVSLGVQSWDPTLLTLLGREHSPEQALQSLRFLRRAGMPQVNVDLMFCLPGQSLALWQETLHQTVDYAPDHISAYNLTYEEDTPFFEQLGLGDWQVDEEKDAAFFTSAHQVLTQAGYRHYETSNFASNNHLSLHNLGYWQGHDYWGIGPGAVGTVGLERFSNASHTKLYIDSLLQEGKVPRTVEHLTPEQKRWERIALLLRTDLGLSLSFLSFEKKEKLPLFEEEGLLSVKENALFLTEKGRLLVDALVLELI